MASNAVARYEVAVSYMKCLRNHAAKSMAVVLDGCCEFASGGKEGTPSFAFCAACGCHRNFHKRVEALIPSPVRSHVEYQLINDNSPVIALPASSSKTIFQPADVNEGEKVLDTGVEKKTRTKINPEKKAVLRSFANRIGWTLRNCDEEKIMQVCSELGITRSILKNWINNNRKKMMPKKQSVAAQDPDVIILQS